MEYDFNDCRSRNADCGSGKGRNNRGAFRLDRIERTDAYGAAGLQLCRRFYEFLQFYHRSSSAGPVPVNSSAGGGHRLPAALFACTVLGAQSSAISPFSSGGSLILGSVGSEEDRNHLFNRLLFIAVPVSVICCAVYNLAVAELL